MRKGTGNQCNGQLWQQHSSGHSRPSCYKSHNSYQYHYRNFLADTTCYSKLQKHIQKMVLKGKIWKLEDRQNHTGVSLIDANNIFPQNFYLSVSRKFRFWSLILVNCDPRVILQYLVSWATWPQYNFLIKPAHKMMGETIHHAPRIHKSDMRLQARNNYQ